MNSPVQLNYCSVMTKLADLEAQKARLLSLFAGPLAGVRFPDVDADILSAHSKAAREAEIRVEALRAQLDEAKSLLEDEEQKLQHRLDRGLAYLRVYAEGNEALLAQLEPMRPAPPPAPRKRGRPPKTSEPLDLGTGSGEATC